MVGKKITTTSNHKRSPHPFEVKFIQQMARLLSDESGFKKEWIEEVLIKTLPDRPIANEQIRPHVTALYLFKPCLLEAMRVLSEDEVRDYFNGDLQELGTLEDTYGKMIEEIPLQKFEDFTDVLPKFEEYMKAQAPSIIDTGRPSEPFIDSLWLQETFTESAIPVSELRVQRRVQLNHNLSATWKVLPGSSHDDENSDAVLSAESLINLMGNDAIKRIWDIREWFQETKGLVDIGVLRKRLTKMREGKNSTPAVTNYLQCPSAGLTVQLPPDFKQKEAAYRTALHQFASSSLRAMIQAIDNESPEELMKECWEILMEELNSDQIRLLLNHSFKALGLPGKIPEGVTYHYGPQLVHRILSAAGLFIEISKDDFLYDIQSALEPLIEIYQDPETKYLRPIDASLYEAIYHCGDSDVRNACAEYNRVINRIRKIEKSVQKTMETVLDLTIERVRETRRRLTELEHYRLTTGFDAGIIVTEPKFSRPQPKQLTAGAFSKDFSEYNSKDPALGKFRFSKGQRKAVQLLFRAWDEGDSAVPVPFLVQTLFSESKIASLPRTKDGRYKWRLTHDLFTSSHKAIKSGFIRPGPLKGDERTYMLDFSFEDSSEGLTEKKGRSTEEK